tara:strand:- start:2 stop:151 length:150 start_codon:yes stop_codon:yes gene_type:complete
MLMQDAAFMVRVSNFCPDTPHLTKNPFFFLFVGWISKTKPVRTGCGGCD